jgi:hypothetical protein
MHDTPYRFHAAFLAREADAFLKRLKNLLQEGVRLAA